MTLQQKLLAKQSKKGFTLVELVVVIAILAILAAIAIPAVIGIINSANESAAQSNAAAIDAACKDLYASVTGGSISSANPGPLSGVSGVTLPAKTAANSSKVSAAKALLVKHAVKYAGLESSIGTDDDASYVDYQYNTSDGHITYKGTSGSLATGCAQLKGSISLGTLYPNN